MFFLQSHQKIDYQTPHHTHPLAGGDGAVWIGLRAALPLGAAGGQQGQGEGQSQKASVGTVFHLKNSFIIKMFCVPESVSKDLTQEREKGSRNF